MMKKLFSLYALTAALVFGQAVRVDPLPTATVATNVGNGAMPQVLALPGSTVNLCGYPSVGVPCTNRAVTYTDSTEATQCPSNAQVILPAATVPPVCTSTSDGQGNFGFWVAPGTYAYTITTANGYNYGPYPLSTVGATVNLPFKTPEAFGAAGDGVTDDTTSFQAAVDAASGSRMVANKSYRLGVINLHSNSAYDFTGGTFSGTNAANIFVGTGLSGVSVIGGNFVTASYSPLVTTPTGTYYSGVPLLFTGSSNILVHGQTSTNCWGSVNVYDSSNVEIYDTQTINCNASIAVLAKTVNMHGINIHDNNIAGGGDDGVFVGTGNTTGTLTINDWQISHNYTDKTRIPSTVTGSVGIRVGYYGGLGTGLFRNGHIIGNIMKDMTQQGMYVFGLRDTTIALNTVDGYARYSGTEGINLGLSIATSADADGIIFTGNKIKGGASTNYYGLAGTWITNSLIAHNEIDGKVAGGFGTFDCANCSGNILADNKITDASGPALTMRSSNNNWVHHNDFSSYVGSDLNVAGTGNTLERNLGDVFNETLYQPGAALNQKWWNFTPLTNGTLTANVLSDDQTASTPWLTVSRTGTVVTDVYLQGATTTVRQLNFSAAPGIANLTLPTAFVVSIQGVNKMIVAATLVTFPQVAASGTTATVCADSSGTLTSAGAGCGASTTFATLGTPASGSSIWCSDCATGGISVSGTTATPNTCASGGAGAFAVRTNGAWKCPF